MSVKGRERTASEVHAPWRGGGKCMYVAHPWHTCHLHFPRCSLSWCLSPNTPVPLLSSQHRFVRPYNLPAKDTTQVVPSKWRFTSPLHPLSSFSQTCGLFLCLLAACILSFLIPQHCDTKRHLPGRDKPILEMPKGGNLMLPHLHLLLRLSLPSFREREPSCAGLQAPLTPQ